MTFKRSPHMCLFIYLCIDLFIHFTHYNLLVRLKVKGWDPLGYDLLSPPPLHNLRAVLLGWSLVMGIIRNYSFSFSFVLFSFISFIATLSEERAPGRLGNTGLSVITYEPTSPPCGGEWMLMFNMNVFGCAVVL